MQEDIFMPLQEAETEIPEALLPEEPAETLLTESLPEQVMVVDIHFRSNSKVYFFDPGELEIKAGDHVIIDTARGQEFGYCAGGNHLVASAEIVPPLRKVLRLATEKDERINAENEQREKKAFDICLQKIQAHGLDMQLVSAECAFDGSKIIFFFTADGRVDFRELVKNLASVFRTRIELRQIGVRDKAKMVGGLGICGRPFCCKEFLEDFHPVSIKMAKTQNLSLNPTKISGTCGRLMCCLKYEQEAYEDLLRTSPKNESFVDTVDGRGTVVDVNLLRQSVRVRMEDQPETVNTYKNCDICVLRSGKAKKTDPPIPKDLAPISSRPRPIKRLVELPDEPLPEVVITGELPAETERAIGAEEASGKAEGKSRRRRRRKPAGRQETAAKGEVREEKPAKQDKSGQDKSKQDKPKQEKPKQEKNRQDKPRPEKGKSEKAKQPKEPAGEKPAEGAAEGSKSHSHRRRRRRPHKPSGGNTEQA